MAASDGITAARPCRRFRVHSASRPSSKRRHRLLGQITLALWFAFTPSTVPDWRADPSLRTVAVLPVGEPMPGLHR